MSNAETARAGTPLNQDLYDRIVAHSADVRLYEMEGHVLNERSIRRHSKRLQALLTKSIHADLQPEVKRAMVELNASNTRHLQDLNDSSESFHTNNLFKVAGDFFKVTAPSKAVAVAQEMLGPNIGLGATLSTRINGIGEAELKRMRDAVFNGLARGDNKQEIIAAVLKTGPQAIRPQMAALLRTAMTNVEASAMERVMQANEALLAGYRFTAVLDSRTSQICSAHDGKTYKLGEKRWRPPLHWNCRSTLVPVLKSKAQLKALQDERVKQAALDAVSDSVLDGKPPPAENYTGWLSRQKLDVQISHLGSEELAQLFNSGRLAVSEFFSSVGRAISIDKLRFLDRKRVFSNPFRQIEAAATGVEADGLLVPVTRPYDLLRSKDSQQKLAQMFIDDESNIKQAMSLTDYRGTTLGGKRSVRLRANNEFDERNQSVDPFTGEVKSTLLYDPDFNVYQERMDFMRNSKVLSKEHKDFIQEFVESLEDKISVNNQSVVIENLRVNFERYLNSPKKEPWKDFASVVRNEAQYSVTNVSRILDRRSRARSEMFDGYGRGDVPKVQIQGKYLTFDELAEGLLDNQRFVQHWTEKKGRGVAQKLYFSGRAPLRSYFFQADEDRRLIDDLRIYLDQPSKEFHWFASKRRSKKALKKALEKVWSAPIKALPMGDRIMAALKGEPTERIVDAFTRELGERYRGIIDMELDFWKQRKSLSDRLASSLAPGNNDAIRVLASCVRTVATGFATDYDSLAIKIGKTLHKEWRPLNPWYTPTLQDCHREGSAILEGMRRNGLIRVMSRGKTRRSAIDLDTGRASGPWLNTTSREVTVLDPDMLELQAKSRAAVIAQRFGLNSARDKLKVLPNAKTYVDSRGRDTFIPIVTRRASEAYDKVLVDRDFADMLNHTMSAKYEVDPQFAGFMDEVARFRDPRGNSKVWDEKNHFRQLIVQRGDQGYAFMQTVRWHMGRGEPFTTIAQIDGRGRVYYQGYLTPTGGEVVRPFLNSHKARPFGVPQMRELSLQLGALIGPATEALTQAGRTEIFMRNEKEILSLGRLLMATTQRDQKIRDFLDHPLISKLEGEEVPKMTRLALEYARANEYTKGRITDPEAYRGMMTKLMIENDASSSGAQIIGLSTRDRSIAINSNVLATTQKNRLYDLVAMDTADDPEFQSIPALKGAGITWNDLQKAAKAQNMVSFYGAGKATQAANIEAKFASVLKKKGYTVVTREDLKSVTSLIDKAIKDADYIGASDTVGALKGLKRELVEVVDGETPISKDLLQDAAELHPDVGEFAEKLWNVRVGIVGPNDFRHVSEIMSRHLAKRAPVTGQFVQFWNLAAKSYVEDTSKVDIPWVTFDGKRLFQRYRPKVQTAIEFYDPETKRMVRNIYEAAAEDGKLQGKASIGRARIGMGVNGNHMNDATIVRRFHLWGRESGVDTASIHDAFFTNIGDVDLAKDALREIYANAVEGETIRNTLLAMRKEGMSEASYQMLLQKAKEAGLIDPPNGITREDVLAPIPPGHDWYGIGP